MREVAALLLGGWLLGTLLVAGVATGNFLLVDRILRASGPAQFQKDVQTLSPEEARLFLRHLSSELNRFYFRWWGWIEMLLGGTLLAVAALSLRDRTLTFGLALMTLVALVMVFYITPEIIRVGRGLDFVPRQPPPPDLALFGRLHAAYSILDLSKLLVGIWMAVRLVRLP